MRQLNSDLVARGVGRRVAELRAQRGLTQAAFAEVCGLTTKHVQKIELGQLNLTLRSLVRVAHHLNVNLSDLFAPALNPVVRRGRPRRIPDAGAADDVEPGGTEQTRGVPPAEYARPAPVHVALAERVLTDAAEPKRGKRKSPGSTPKRKARSKGRKS